MSAIQDSNKTDINDNTTVAIADGDQIDSHGRHRIVTTKPLTSLYFANTSHSLLLNSAVVGTASAAFNSTAGSLQLSTSTGATDSIIVQTKRYLRYNPGVSHLMTVAGTIGAAKTNVRKRWGYFDTNDGLFFEQISTGIGVVVRTSTSGSIVDTKVNQASWNIDVMDGSNSSSNPSGVSLDVSKNNVYIIDFAGHGAGRIRFGILLDGRVQYVHQIDNSNTLTASFMRSFSRPCRAELTNTGVATATTVDINSFVMVREDTDDPLPTYDFVASVGSTKKSINSTTPLPILSIRPKTTFNGVTNRVPIQANDFDVLAVQDSVLVSVILNSTLTGAAFASVGTNSSIEYDTSATATSGGTIIYQGYVAGGGKGGIALGNLGDLLILGLDIAGTVPDTLTIAIQKVAANVDCFSAIRWSEYQ